MSSPAPNRAARRASAKSNGHRALTIAEWTHPKVIWVDLPGWGEVAYELPDMVYELASGQVPNDLVAAAERALGIRAPVDEDAPQSERQQAQFEYFRLQCVTIASHLRDPDPVAKFGSLEAAADWVGTPGFIPAHRLYLWGLSVSHQVDSEAAAATFRLGVKSKAPVGDGRTDGDAAE